MKGSTLAGISVTYTSHVHAWYRLHILVPRVHVVYSSSLSQIVNYPPKEFDGKLDRMFEDWLMLHDCIPFMFELRTAYT